MRCALFGVVPLMPIVVSCGGSTPKIFTPLAGPDGGYVSIGTPCVPYSIEDSPSFGGFQIDGISVVSASGAPDGAPVCIAYFFQGRVSCPYGQAGDTDGSEMSCETPNGQLVTVPVAPQCINRRSSEVVLWSCQCGPGSAPADGGRSYCDCPSGTTCTFAGQLGSYCLPPGAMANGDACSAECEPGARPCE